MIHGHKPAAYFSTRDGEGRLIEGEQRQCVHCQYLWDYVPGSGDRRGWCLNCGGFLCGRAECFADQQKYIYYMQMQYGQTRSCVPFEEWNSRVRENLEHLLPIHGALTVTESGLIIPKG